MARFSSAASWTDETVFWCMAGIDGGGVFKEFFTSLCKEVFDTDRGLWLANKKNELYPNPHAYATEGAFLYLPCTWTLLLSSIYS